MNRGVAVSLVTIVLFSSFLFSVSVVDAYRFDIDWTPQMVIIIIGVGLTALAVILIAIVLTRKPKTTRVPAPDSY